MRTYPLLKGLFTAAPIIAVTLSCVHDPFLDLTEINNGQPNVPGCSTDGTVCFEGSVLPLFISYCARAGCHDAISHKEGFVLTDYVNIMSKGVVPGNSADSKVFEVLLETGEEKMPPDGSLTTAQRDSIRLWIDQGARNTTDCDCYCNPNTYLYGADIKPIIDRACTGCHKPGSLSGNIDLSDYAHTRVQVDNGKLWGTITHAVGYVPMPQGSKLSDCEITKIDNWIISGASNN